ncbi:MAG: hypothetical protein AB7P12_09890 [Alphaproteobacteria bacterium]
MMIPRRTLLRSLGALLMAPAIVRVGSIMPVRACCGVELKPSDPKHPFGRPGHRLLRDEIGIFAFGLPLLGFFLTFAAGWWGLDRAFNGGTLGRRLGGWLLAAGLFGLSCWTFLFWVAGWSAIPAFIRLA